MSCCKLFICHSNDGERHLVLTWEEGKLPAHERLLLDLNSRGGAFSPGHDGWRLDSDIALASYFSQKYGDDDKWIQGNPLSSAKEEDESDEEVVEFLCKRRKRRENEYDWTIETQYIEHTDTTNRIIAEYVGHLQMIASPPTEEEGYNRYISAARKELEKEPELVKQILALDSDQFEVDLEVNPSPFALRQLKEQAEIADGTKRRRLEKEIASLKSELASLPS